MDLQTRSENNAVVVTISGRLDAVTAPDYEKSIRELIDGGNICIVVDFEQLDYISSAGLRGLLLMAKLLNAKGGRACLANVKGNVRSVFDMCGFNTLFKMENSVAEALAVIAG
ncbi:MAG: STAS domain-containing protein [Methylobacter tundripaludum]|uniref:Anti-sigma factor antagonist n=1 Tax=Methylobacter tundripaludum TaxID=173365 RepID=A0A2S6H3M6_9GAMM|nr:STAS domain-containing protein [Methylobacter tundripaludum]MCF7964871.1 STAS domain-containing protein [Methylobacter tundripaludum]MCK9635082.1 STAS domain-containing protein [Methylobacter tundripaludum]PPK72006.1 anti-anti-sigma factor [Methylobacter tundripaludum]